MQQPTTPTSDASSARNEFRCYGMGLGIILLDDVYPGFPGDVRNASAYPFPIQYEIAEGVDIPALVTASDKSPCLPPVLRAAQKLARMGCRAIAAECGYFAYFQRELAASVDVPVFSSALLQVPLAQQIVGPERVVGILVAQAAVSHRPPPRIGGYPVGQQLCGRGRDGRAALRGIRSPMDEGAAAAIPRRRITTRPGRNSSRKPCAFMTPIRRWARWSWNARDFPRSRELSSTRFTSRSSVGARCWITRIRSSCTAIITGTFEAPAPRRYARLKTFTTSCPKLNWSPVRSKRGWRGCNRTPLR